MAIALIGGGIYFNRVAHGALYHPSFNLQLDLGYVGLDGEVEIGRIV